MRIAVLIKQVPKFDELSLGPDGRLRRDGLELEMNPFCRRAVAQGIAMAAESGGECAVLTLGPPAALDILQEALACGANAAWLISDVAFAGSDTLVTSKALAAALTLTGPWDLVLVGRNSVDSDTGQVGPQVAELLGLPFLSGVRALALAGDELVGTSEYDDGSEEVRVQIPAVASCAERLCNPAKATPESRSTVPVSTVKVLSAADIGPGPWGLGASPTQVGRVRVIEKARARLRLEGTVQEQVTTALRLIAERQGTDRQQGDSGGREVQSVDLLGARGSTIATLGEPGRPQTSADLLAMAGQLARRVGASAISVLPVAAAAPGQEAVASPADVVLRGSIDPEDVARGLAEWCTETQPWALIAASTSWAREVFSRLAVRLDAGLIGDALDLDVDGGRLVAWKAAFGGALVAAITSTSSIQLVTVQPGNRSPKDAHGRAPSKFVSRTLAGTSRVVRGGVELNDDLGVLEAAQAVVGVGTGVRQDEYHLLRPLLDAFGAELAATRRVADNGWLPRARQLGITGRSIGPRLYFAIGSSGKFNHMVGVRRAEFVLAINNDPTAPVFDFADAGIVGDWHEVVPVLAAHVVSGAAVGGSGLVV